MTSLKPRPKQGRLGSRKSNDGCITCKIRKVKCDELHPSCKRCLTTGRKCDGYPRDGNMAIRSPSSDGAVVHVKRPTTYTNFEHVEVQSFEFFMRRVVPASARVVDKHFWHQVIPQLSHSDPVIWDAVIALSCLIQHPQYSRTALGLGSKKALVTSEQHRRALTWYSKSIAGLRKRMKQTTARSATVVISCILYICIECLQDNTTEAVGLYQQAVSMMGMSVADGHATCPVTQFESSLGNALRALLQNMSASLRLPVKQGSIEDFSETTFQSLSDAKDKLYIIMFAAHDFIVYMIELRINTAKDWTPSPELVSRQHYLRTVFLKWRSALENMNHTPASESSQNGEHEDESYSTLIVVYGQYFILVCIALNMYETAFDEFIPTFQNMVDHASRVVSTQNQELRPVFMFETRIIPSLFFVAIKCRHPIIRRQAISLLRTGTEIENTWKADAMADHAEWHVGVEEAGDIHGVFCSEPRSTELPCETDRVYHDIIIELPDAEGRLANFHRYQKWEQDESHAWSRIQGIVRA